MRSRSLHFLALLLALFPFSLLMRAVWRNAVDLPYWDEWTFVPMVTDAADGHVDLEALWSFHNEHRILLPRLVMLALAACTRYDVRYEQVASLVFAAGAFLVLAELIRRRLRPRAPWLASLLVLAVAFCTCSMVQWESWAWGWMLQAFLASLSAVSAVLSVSSWRWRWRDVAAMTAIAALGAWSFSAGLAMLPLVPIALAVDPRRREGDTAGRNAKLAVLTTALALIGVLAAPHVDPAGDLSFEPAAIAGFALELLGAAMFGSDSGWPASSAAALGLALFVACAVAAWRRGARGRVDALPWILLGAYAIVFTVLVTIGRLRFGVAAAVAPRYTTFTLLFWIALGGLLATSVAERVIRLAPRRSRVLELSCGFVLCGGSALAFWSAWPNGVSLLEARHDLLLHGVQELRTPRRSSDEFLSRVHVDTDLVRAGAEALRAHRLGSFAPPHESSVAAYLELDRRIEGGVRRVDLDEPPWWRCRVMPGFVRPDDKSRNVEAVLAVIGGSVVAEAQVAPLGSSDFATFVLHVPVSSASPGENEVELFARHADGKTVSRLTSSAQLHVPEDERFFMMSSEPTHSGPIGYLRPWALRGSWVLAARPGAEIGFAAKEGATRVTGGFGIVPVGDPGVEVTFTIESRSEAGVVRSLYSRRLDPSLRAEDAEAQSFDVALDPGERSELALRVSGNPEHSERNGVGYWTQVEIR